MYCTICGARLPEDVKVEQGLDGETNEPAQVMSHTCQGKAITVYVSEGG